MNLVPNPVGIRYLSPGLRSHPGTAGMSKFNPNGVASIFDTNALLDLQTKLGR